MPGASLVGMRTGFQKLGAINGSILVFENLLDSKSLFLTGNTDSVYFSTWLNLKDGPWSLKRLPRCSPSSTTFGSSTSPISATLVLTRAKVASIWCFRRTTKAKCRRVTLSPARAPITCWLMGRGFKVDGDLKPGVESIKKNLRIYPLAQAKNPPDNEIHQWLRGRTQHGSRE